jgi:hypothetical protein
MNWTMVSRTVRMLPPQEVVDLSLALGGRGGGSIKLQLFSIGTTAMGKCGGGIMLPKLDGEPP